jgi:orotate phosphoribosyltransferase
MLAPIYTDNRLLISHPKEWDEVMEEYAKVIHTTIGLNHIDVLSGTATAAIPHAAVLALRLKLPMVYVRTSKKEHGKENRIEGALQKGQKVLIVEDLITTGKSSLDNVYAIREAGGLVTDCIAITTSTKNSFVDNFAGAKVKLRSLTDIETTVQMAATEGYITKSELQLVEAFLENPKGWGEMMGFE